MPIARAKVIISKICIFVFVFATAESKVFAQEQWDAYQPRSLSEIIKEHLSELSDNITKTSKISFLLTSDEFPSRVSVVYTGNIRTIPSKREEMILEWAKARGIRKNVVDLFKDEVLFLEDSSEYWIPVQKQLLPLLERELKKGDKVQLFLIWIGARKEESKVDWVFLANEFTRR